MLCIHTCVLFLSPPVQNHFGCEARDIHHRLVHFLQHQFVSRGGGCVCGRASGRDPEGEGQEWGEGAATGVGRRHILKFQIREECEWDGMGMGRLGSIHDTGW